MRLRDFSNAVLVALVSIGLVVGALSISLVEFAPQATPAATNKVPPSPVLLTVTQTITPTLTPTQGLESPTPSITPTFTNTATPPASCQPPAGWGQIIIQAGETLDSISVRYRTSKDELRSANCLLIDNLVAGTVLYAPAVATITPVICSPGVAGWAKSYVVKSGDTIYAIATSHYATASQLRSVNCRVSDLIHVGEILWVPNVVTRTPVPRPTLLPANTVTPAVHPTDPLTQTALPFTITVIPSDTPVPATSTTIPTLTAVPTFTAITTSPTAFPNPP